MTAKSKTAKYYAANPKARKKHVEYQKKHNKKPKEVAKRKELIKARRKRGIYGKGGGDLHHGKNGKLIREAPSKNRGRAEKSRLKGSKRKKKS
jgi:hypothetical protein